MRRGIHASNELAWDKALYCPVLLPGKGATCAVAAPVPGALMRQAGF